MIKVNKPNRVIAKPYQQLLKHVSNGVLIDYCSGKYNEELFDMFFNKNIIYRPLDDNNIEFMKNGDARIAIKSDNVTCISLINVLSKTNEEQQREILSDINDMYREISYNLVNPPVLFFANTKALDDTFVKIYFPNVERINNSVVILK